MLEGGMQCTLKSSTPLLDNLGEGEGVRENCWEAVRELSEGPLIQRAAYAIA